MVESFAPQPVLQPYEGVPESATYVPSIPGNVLWGRLPCRRDEFVAEVRDGGTVVVDTVSHEGLLPDQGSDPVSYFGSHGVPSQCVLTDAQEIVHGITRSPHTDGPHVVTGPIRVRGAHPGDVLAVTMSQFDRRVPYGVISTRHARGVLSTVQGFDGDYGQFCQVKGDGAFFNLPFAAGTIEFPIRPFLGIVGVTPDSDIRPSSIPPSVFGGNVDLRELCEGSTLFLPVEVEGAGLYVGDPHFAQGDGEVALTALEASLRATLRVDVIPRAERRTFVGGVQGPFALSSGRIVVTGLDRDLNSALRRCVENAVELLSRMFGVPRRQAYLFLSAAVNFEITQAVDIVKGVHAIIDLSALSDTPGYDAATRFLRPYADRSLEVSLDAYESALMRDDVAGMDALFAEDPDGVPVVRSDSAGMLVGHKKISDFRRTRGGAPSRLLLRRVIRGLGCDAACVESQFTKPTGGLVSQTQVWRRLAGRWKIVDAHLSYPRPAIDDRIWRIVGGPLVPPTREGPLTGLSVAVKDLFDVRGYKVGAGNPAFLSQGSVRKHHAWAVDRLISAGASIRGIAQMDEFAYSLAGVNSHYGAAPNLRAPGRVGGGSSSGSASAVAAGQADIGLGTDTAGSIRVPASYQGLWGIRTTHGLVPRDGVVGLSESFDAVGLLARDAATLAVATEALVPSMVDGHAQPPSSDVHFLICPDVEPLVADEALGSFRGWRDSLARLATAGKVPLTPEILKEWARIFSVVRGYEAWGLHGDWIRHNLGALSPEILARFRSGEGISRGDYDSARNALGQARRMIRDMVGDGFLVMPAASGPAPLLPRETGKSGTLDEMRRSTIRLTSVAGVGGLPAVVVPGTLPSGLPFGVCVIGPAGSDRALVSVAQTAAQLCGIDGGSVGLPR